MPRHLLSADALFALAIPAISPNSYSPFKMRIASRSGSFLYDSALNGVCFGPKNPHIPLALPKNPSELDVPLAL